MRNAPINLRVRPEMTRRFCLAGIALAFAFSCSIVAASRADDNDSSTQVSKPTGEKDPAGGAQWDSVYAGIQEGFQRVRPALQRGCFDCHTGQTQYPWYHNLPGVRALIDSDIRKARKRLDMSKGFPFTGREQQANALADIKEQITAGDMPPWEFRLMHWDAKPSQADADSIVSWIDRSLRTLAAHKQYPFDRPDLVPSGPAADVPPSPH